MDKNGQAVYNGTWEKGYYHKQKDVWIRYEDEKKVELFDNGSIRYEGGWKKGEYSRKGKFYYENGKIEYVGE